MTRRTTAPASARDPARDRVPHGGPQRLVGAHRRGGRLRGHLGQRPHDVGRVRRARQQRALLDAGARPGRASWRTRRRSPILLDGDTGYGNFNNMRRLVRKLEQVGVAGVTIEDKLFPKTNSFLRGEQQPLADIDEFCGKIKAGKDSQADPDFVLVARVEALIAGWGLDEALRRAEAYHRAGADAILIHSRQSSRGRDLRLPRRVGEPRRRSCSCRPSTGARRPRSFRARRCERGRSGPTTCCARRSRAMQATARRLPRRARSLIDVEPQVAPLPRGLPPAGRRRAEAGRAPLSARRARRRAVGDRPRRRRRRRVSRDSPRRCPKRC